MEKHCILIVDKEPTIRSGLARLLQRAGYDTLLAESGDDGFALLEKKSVTAIISDHRMPGQSGIEFLTRVKARYPEPIRILLTGQSDINEALSAVDQGLISHLFMKPWDNDNLEKMMERLIGEFEKAHPGRRLTSGPQSPNEATTIEEFSPGMTMLDEVEEGIITLDDILIDESEISQYPG